MDVRKKVLLDLFAGPSALIPAVGGLSLLIGSWAFGGAPIVSFLGVVGVLAGLGVSATRLIFGLEKITNDAYEYVHDEEIKKQEKKLDELDEKLREDQDPRTQNSLRELRELYRAFAEDVRNGKIARSSHEVLGVMEELFRTCVAQLERSYELWQTAQARSGPVRETLLQEREQVVSEVIDTVRHVERTVEPFRCFSAKKSEDNLSRLRRELDAAMQVARRTEERIASWDQKAHTEAEFE